LVILLKCDITTGWSRQTNIHVHVTEKTSLI
jgi:hypothetical protein